MHVLNVVDVNEALPRALSYLRDRGTAEVTRNGPALVAPGPVSTVYRDPRRRVLFDVDRDANPFFHLFESLWILAGRQDVKFLSWFNSRIADYSDNGRTFHGAYGHRLRESAAGFDQIDEACKVLRRDSQSRQAVLQIWDSSTDLARDTPSKDIPCNDLVFLRVRKDKDSLHPTGKSLDIMVSNRSNDAVWGAYGANAVQFSFLQEYLALQIGCGIGEYTQVSFNLHVYTENPYWQKWHARYRHGGVHVPGNPYSESLVPISTLASPNDLPLQLDHDLFVFFEGVNQCATVLDFASLIDRHKVKWQTPFFQFVVIPMLYRYADRKTIPKHFSPTEVDWHWVGEDWIARRAAAAKKD